jgi:hypothetical protein
MFSDFELAEDVLLLHPVRSLFTLLYHLSIDDWDSQAESSQPSEYREP